MGSAYDARTIGLWAASRAVACTEEIGDCKDVLHFIATAGELLLSGSSERQVLVHLGGDIYERSVYNLEESIKVHLGAGIFLDMGHAEAKAHFTRRLQEVEEEVEEMHRVMADCAYACVPAK